MAHIFLSYANEDRELARRVVGLLEKAQLPVWWDRRIPAGMNWNDVLDKALTEMQCMVVLWTRHSIESDWVYEEAEEGRKRGVLLPVLLEAVQPPRGFRSIQCADLSGWDGNIDTVAAQQLLADLKALAGNPDTNDNPPHPAPPDLPGPEIQTDVLTRLRQQMLLSPNAFELRRGLYELEAYLKDAASQAQSAEARMLLGQLQTALQRAEAFEKPRAAASPPAPSYASNKSWWLWAGVAALVLLLGVMAIKRIPVNPPAPISPSLKVSPTQPNSIAPNNNPATVLNKPAATPIQKAGTDLALAPLPASPPNIKTAPSAVTKKPGLSFSNKPRCSALLERISLGDEALSESDRQLLKECRQ